MSQRKLIRGKLVYFKKVVPKCRSLTLEQIYGVPDNKTPKGQCQEIGGDTETFLEYLEEIGRIQGRKKNL